MLDIVKDLNTIYFFKHMKVVYSSAPSTQDLLTKPPSVTFRKPPNLRQLIVDTSLCTHSTATPTGSRPCNQRQYKTCSIHHPVNSFTSSRTNVTYPITTHADCKSMNLIYHLKCTECNVFYIGETRRSLSDRMNGHWFTTMASNPDLPVAIHTQSHQVPFQKCWSVSVIHKLPDSTPDHICRQLKLHTNLSYNHDTTLISISVNPPTFHPRLGGT